ncbi:MAG: hypothetical protein D3924_10080, partial [Candidatus Electrothrix sp. AR4]|nr:hypothetical protein [Candidatus Electrothrix sp. AR4]
MSRFKKTTSVQLALLFALIIGSTSHALAITVDVPVPADDPLIVEKVNEVLATPAVNTMRNNVRDATILAQAPLRPMEVEMMPKMTLVMQERMRTQIRPLIQAELSGPANPNGMW